MKNTYIYSHNSGSHGASELAKALDVDRIRHHGSRFRGASWKTVINWGSSEVPSEVHKCRILNRPEIVRIATNKLSFFRSMTDVSVVPWTNKRSEAEQWLKDGRVVVVRTVLTGHSGNGILIIEPGDELPLANLYTVYEPKSHEFRVHVLNKEIIDAQRKIRDPDREPLDWKVRSHNNGFIYVRGGVVLPEDVQRQAIAAVVASGLDFGAADVIWSDKRRKAWVLEINTAPGLEGQTIESYAEAFKRHLR